MIVGSLKARTLYRLRIEDGQLVDEEKLLAGLARIRDVETLVTLVRSLGADAEWTGPQTLNIHAKEVRVVDLDADACARIRASILLAGLSGVVTVSENTNSPQSVGTFL